MDVVTATRRVKRYFGDEYDTFINDDDIYGWFYDAEMEIIRKAGWENSTTAAANVFPQSVPTNVQIKRISVAGTSLNQITREEIDLLGFSVSTTGTPLYWYVLNNSVYLYPVSDGYSETVTIHYNKTPTMIVDNAGNPDPNTFTVPEVWHNDIIKYALARAHDKNLNDSQSEKMQDLFDRNTNVRADESQATDSPLYKTNDPFDYDDYIGMY